uniref:Deleted in malignant brain tumors 1 protein-like n=1 Tax=Caenorhabditis tropicalis TaxID=1561998 RepID=A0A1I7U565_9PELO
MLLWIGLYCFDSDTSKCLWDDSTGSAEMYDNFAGGFPLIDVGKCVYYSVKGALVGQWLNGECESETRAFICELPFTFADDCPNNYNGHCYTFHPRAPFVHAQTTCERECGNLAVIQSEAENRWISTVANNHSLSNYMFIGAIWPYPNVYAWVDGSRWDYNNMDPTYTHSDDCVVMAIDTTTGEAPGYWFSAPCEDGYISVCKRPAGITCNATAPVVVTPVPSNPSYCNAGIIMSPGFITSPNFPANYDNNLHCVYQLATLGSYSIILRFRTLVTEPSYDTIAVYDGDSIDSPSLGTYSGTRTPFSLISTGNTMTVVFRTDGSGVLQGFNARFTSYSR